MAAALALVGTACGGTAPLVDNAASGADAGNPVDGAPAEAEPSTATATTSVTPDPPSLPVPQPSASTETDRIDSDYHDWSHAGISEVDIVDQLAVADFGAVPDDGQSDSDAFAAAIAAAGGGGVTAIDLAPGRYELTSTLFLDSGVVLRGTGPDSVLVVDTGGRDEPGIEARGEPAGPWIAVTSDVAVGATRVPVADVGPFRVGHTVELEQGNDDAVMNTRDEWDVDWGEGSVGELNVVVGIEGSELLLATPLHSDYDVDLGVAVRVVDPIRDVGLESLTVQRRDEGYASTMVFAFALNVWLDDVVGYRTSRAHVDLAQVYGCRISGSVFHHATDYGDGGRAYGVSLARHATNCLVIDNTLFDLRHAIIIQLGASGNVIAYNDARGSAGYEDRQPRADLSLHGHWPQANLFEGNVFDRVVFADWWGPSGPTNTLFRNCVRDYVVVADQSDNQNLVGNVVGLGGITVEPDIDGTTLEANVALVPETGATVPTIELPASLWRAAAPDFLAAWPPIDVSSATPSCEVPASSRAES